MESRQRLILSICPHSFFLSDDSLLQMLNASAIGGEISTADWLDFKNNEVSALERLVNNNPLLYGVRVYAVNDSVQEMMPILYNASRMKKQEVVQAG